MSIALSERNSAPTFLMLMEKIKTDPTLPDHRRRSLASYVRCFCRVLELEPGVTPADLRPLQSRMERIYPRRLGLSRGHWSNVQGGVRSALRHVGIQSVPGRAESDGRRCPVRRPALFRDGLLIAFLAARPLRASSLSSLRLGESLIRSEDTWWIRLEGDQMKSGDRFEGPMPDQLASHLDRYATGWRPLLLGGGESDRAWINQYGRPMTKHSIYRRVCNWTERRLGVRANPHLFRDCAATAIATEDPEHVRYASVLLQHRSPATAERFYNQARTLEAARLYQKNLADLRRSLTSRGKLTRERITSMVGPA